MVQQDGFLKQKTNMVISMINFLEPWQLRVFCPRNARQRRMKMSKYYKRRQMNGVDDENIYDTIRKEPLQKTAVLVDGRFTPLIRCLRTQW